MRIPYQTRDPALGTIVIPGDVCRFNGRAHVVASVTFGKPNGPHARLNCGSGCPEDCPATIDHVAFDLLADFRG